MSSHKHRTAPDHDLNGWPSGIKYIVGNEGAERFSYYGMRAILYVYLTILIHQTGLEESVATANAKASYHLFVAGVYAFPILGALLADKLLGKYHTILWLSIVYCLGHACLAVFESNLTGIYVGLALIAVGSGGIKPCVSAHVGDQFGRSNWHLIPKVFQLFYFIINFGAFFSIILIPILKSHYGYGVAFGVPGILMFIATVAFWLGRHDFVHVPANPGGKLGLLDVAVGSLLFVPLAILLFGTGMGLTDKVIKIAVSGGAVVAALFLFGVRQRIQEDDGFLSILIFSMKSLVGIRPRREFVRPAVSDKIDAPGDTAIANHWFFGSAAARYGNAAADGPFAVFRIISVFFLVSVFWMLFDQQSTTWLDQVKLLDRTIDFGWLGLGSVTIMPEQVSGVNAVLVMILIPVVSWWATKLERLGVSVTPLRKMTVGMIFASLGFVAVALLQEHIMTQGTGTVSIMWQLIPYIIMTTSEVLVSVTGLEFAYTQAPHRMKSIVMGFWLLCVSFGNFATAELSRAWDEWSLAKTFWGCAALMIGAALLFGFRALFYSYRSYPQE